MGKVKGKHRLDKYYHLAKEHGYRSRAAWKLVQLDSKFGFLRSAHSVLDLCAAPGGWMQVSVERVPVGSLVVGVDLDPIRPIRGAISAQEDITTPKCRATVKRIMAENGCRAFDLILHDGSPNVGGAWAKEATSQNALVIDSVKLATELLAPKGTFVTKVFRSQDYTAVLYCLRQLFEKVEVDKPQASRSASAEIYILGFKYKAPAKIDPRLLDVKHLFQGGKEPPKVVDVLRGTKQKRHRDGYEDGDTTLRKLCSASEFICSETPLEILGSVSSITFNDPESLPLKDHTLTTEEVKALCDDLRVLGKQDFKHLLRWRMHVRKALSPSEKAPPAATKVEHESKEDEDERVLNEMEELTNAMERKKKRAKKILAKRQAKDKARKALGRQMDAVEDGYFDQELFSLSSIKGKKDLVAVDNNEYDDDAGDIRNSESEESHDEADEYTSSDVDSEEERRRYDEKVEKLLDEAYENFVAKKEGSAKQRKRSKQSYSKDDQLVEGDDGDSMIHSDQDSDNDGAEHEANPLMVPLDENAPTQEEIAAQWFSQDVFMDADDPVELDKDDSEDEMQVDLPVKHPKVTEKKMEDTQEPNGKKNNKLQVARSSKVEDDFEIVPAPATDSSDSSSSDESDEDDITTKAEILACAKKMLTKKQREQMLDDAYNKYMFHDEGLPKWFLDEEKRHRQPIKPVTKEEIAAMRAQFKEIDARPAKKVAEAKARKKRVALRKLEKVRKKANSISDQADISDRSKTKMIEQLYKKATPKKPEKEYVVAKKGVQVKAGKGKVLVDRRMKKDTRKHGMSKQAKGKKGKQKGKGSMKGKGKKGNKAP
ncbi:putative SAM-dependent rRNA methyltransferase SPB1 [Handroanthus impetiginosus]|uniref:Putative rRNA methyltransferase n=1 Tax=Handroanthus impetiginosus TaxID=429701 RepID=A0A2G9H4F7_9LAMI|nr:putative SAM-dependent rRNA methyltransferase SPB1 [Handroanthus impetiginosus]